MKKIFFIFVFITILLSSCGKKSDPFYNGENKNSAITSTQKTTFS